LLIEIRSVGKSFIMVNFENSIKFNFNEDIIISITNIMNISCTGNVK